MLAICSLNQIFALLVLFPNDDVETLVEAIPVSKKLCHHNHSYSSNAEHRTDDRCRDRSFKHSNNPKQKHKNLPHKNPIIFQVGGGNQ